MLWHWARFCWLSNLQEWLTIARINPGSVCARSFARACRRQARSALGTRRPIRGSEASIFEDDLGDGLIRGVRDAYRDVFHAEGIGDLPGFALQ
jgi:hypothetical protein